MTEKEYKLFLVNYLFTNPDTKQTIQNSIMVQGDNSAEVKSLFLNSRAFANCYKVLGVKEQEM